MYFVATWIYKTWYCYTKKLDDIKTLRTFVRTSDGYNASDEGFVASSSGSVVKLVNRLEFSRQTLQ